MTDDHSQGNPPYPLELDYVWLAADKANMAAAFITAGEGPIPLSILRRGDFNDINVEQDILSMNISSSAKMNVSVPRPDSFINLATRGLFVYDAGEAVFDNPKYSNSYKLVSYPDRPIKFSDLTSNVAPLFAGVIFDQINFEEWEFINPNDYFECLSGSDL